MLATVLATVLAAGASASPGPSPSPAPAAIGNVTVVTGSPQSLHRAPQAASALSQAQLRAATAPSLDAALRDMPGVDRDRSNAPFTNYGQLRLSFSGAGQDRGTLLVDGVPAQDGFGGQVDWNVYPAASIYRAELLRGPGSALYGSGAIGGALALTTLPPALQNGGFVDAATGGAVVDQLTVAKTGALGSWASAVTLSTQRLSYDVIPPGQGSRVDRPAVSTADVAQVRLRNAGPNGSIDLEALVADDAQQDGRPNDGFSRSYDLAAATWTTGRVATLAITAFARQSQVQNLADRYPTPAPGHQLYHQDVPSSDAGLRARWDRPVPDGDWSLLAERRLITGRSEQWSGITGLLQSDVAGTQGVDGLALQRTWDGARFGAVAGARYDAVHTDALGPRDANALSPRLDLRYTASSATVFRAAFGTGLRAPFLNELIRSYRIGTITYENNRNLVPERSRSAQLGVDVANSLGRFALDYTATLVHDAIDFRTLSATLQQRSNIAQTNTGAYTAEYTRGNPCARVHAFGTLQHDRIVAGSPAEIGKRLPYVPDDAAAIDVDRGTGAFTGTLEFSYSGPTYADDLQQQPLGHAFLIGGRVTLHNADGTALSLAVDNLADRVYLTSIDRLGPPASVTLRATVPIGSRPQTADRRRAAVRSDGPTVSRRDLTRRTADANLVALDGDVERVDAGVVAERHPAVRQLERPGVPRAGDGHPVDPAFGERPALVRTRVVEGIERPVDVEERDLALADGDGFPGPGRHVGDARHRHELVVHQRTGSAPRGGRLAQGLPRLARVRAEAPRKRQPPCLFVRSGQHGEARARTARRGAREGALRGNRPRRGAPRDDGDRSARAAGDQHSRRARRTARRGQSGARRAERKLGAVAERLSATGPRAFDALAAICYDSSVAVADPRSLRTCESKGDLLFPCP